MNLWNQSRSSIDNLSLQLSMDDFSISCHHSYWRLDFVDTLGHNFFAQSVGVLYYKGKMGLEEGKEKKKKKKGWGRRKRRGKEGGRGGGGGR